MMRQTLYIIILYAILAVIVGCTTESDRMRMRAGLDSINVRNRSGQPFTVSEVQPYVTFFDEHGTPNDRLLAHYLLGLAYDTKGSGTSVPRTSEYDHQNPMILKFRLQRVDFLCGETCNIRYVFDSESFGFHLAGIV